MSTAIAPTAYSLVHFAVFAMGVKGPERVGTITVWNKRSSGDELFNRVFNKGTFREEATRGAARWLAKEPGAVGVTLDDRSKGFRTPVLVQKIKVPVGQERASLI